MARAKASTASGTRRHLARVALVGVAACALSGHLASRQAPRNGLGTPEATGTAILAGQVLTDDNPPRPVRRATVQLNGGELHAGQRAITDDAGRFAFAWLAGGRYLLSAARPGFVPTAFGAKRPGGPGIAVSVADGQHVNNIQLRILRGAVITGTIRDETGTPVADQTVIIMQDRYNPFGDRTLQTVGLPLGFKTDDRGVYRVYGLAPGDYVVMTTPNVFGGARTDAHQVTSADVQWAAEALRSLTRSTTASAGPPASAPNVVYAPVFYPGTARADSAETITLREGEERTGIDISTALVPTATITGTVAAPDGAAPPPFQVFLLAHNATERTPFSGFSSTPSITNGTFRFQGVTPGDYTIAVRPRGNAATGGRSGAPPSSALFAMTDISVNGQDTNVALTLGAGASISGHVTFASATVTPAFLSRVRVNLAPVITTGGVAMGVSAATLDPMGAFSFAGVPPGRYRLVANAPGWQPLQAMVGDKDALDTPLEVSSSDIGNIELTFTDQPADLSGVIQDAAGLPAPDYFVVVFASDRAFWTPQSRRIQAKRPGNDGRFSFPNLPAGTYRLAAVTDVEQGEWYDGAFLGSLVPESVAVTVRDGEHHIQNIQLAAGR